MSADIGQTAEAHIDGGVVHGMVVDGISRYAGIRYAAPPTGPLRFMPPRPVALSGSIDARAPAAIAPQARSRLADAMGEIDGVQDEDCLHLTVWTPRADGARRPVLVWLHGGAWQSGGGALDWYHGAALARRGDVVVVAPNYRLGVLGWLPIPGGAINAGLLDQQAAIEWVAAHIQHFGGNPDDITLMGQSAGAVSTAQLLEMAPRFQKAILQSPGFGRGLRPLAAASRLAEVYMQALGAPSLLALQALPVHALIDGMRHPEVLAAVQADSPDRGLAYPVAPNEGHEDVMATAHAHPAIPCLIGHTRNEYAVFKGFGVDAASDARGDAVYGQPSRQWAALATACGRPTWTYRVDYAANARFGACHCVELPFIFGTFDAFREAPIYAGADRMDVHGLTEHMQGSWLSFIRTGTPGWEKGDTCVFDSASGVTAEAAER